MKDSDMTQQRYFLPIHHPECGHWTAVGWNTGLPTEEEIEAALNEPCPECTAKYRFSVQCSCGHKAEIFSDDLDAVRPQMVEFYGARPCPECEAVVIRINKKETKP